MDQPTPVWDKLLELGFDSEQAETLQICIGSLFFPMKARENRPTLVITGDRNNYVFANLLSLIQHIFSLIPVVFEQKWFIDYYRTRVNPEIWILFLFDKLKNEAIEQFDFFSRITKFGKASETDCIFTPGIIFHIIQRNI